MKSLFICGFCKKRTVMGENILKTNRNGNKIRCPKCNRWQEFNGTMEKGAEKG